MNNEKILESARKNKNRSKEFEHKESTRANLLGSLVALFVGIGLFLLEYLVNNTLNAGLISVGMTASGVQSLYEGIRLKKCHFIFLGILQILVAIIFISVFIWQVISL